MQRVYLGGGFFEAFKREGHFLLEKFGVDSICKCTRGEGAQNVKRKESK